MNYQHYYHVGNFADIFKHIILCLCLEKLHEKPTSFLAIDTHSSLGKYSLLDERINKSNEFNEGLQKILQRPDFTKILPEKFLAILAKINVCSSDELPHKIRFYAGSPLIIKNFLRNNDRAIFAESQTTIFNNLKKDFAGNKKILCLLQNGFDLLKSKLPPAQKRAIILIDPAFEKKHNKISDDYDNALNSLAEAYRRFACGIYLLWHPIIEGEEILLENFYQKIQQLKFTKITHVICDIGKNSNNPNKMHSCGMFIINMPWQIDDKINHYFPKIIEALRNDEKAFFTIKNLKR